MPCLLCEALEIGRQFVDGTPTVLRPWHGHHERAATVDSADYAFVRQLAVYAADGVRVDPELAGGGPRAREAVPYWVLSRPYAVDDDLLQTCDLARHN